MALEVVSINMTYLHIELTGILISQCHIGSYQLDHLIDFLSYDTVVHVKKYIGGIIYETISEHNIFALSANYF